MQLSISKYNYYFDWCFIIGHYCGFAYTSHQSYCLNDFHEGAHICLWSMGIYGCLSGSGLYITVAGKVMLLRLHLKCCCSSRSLEINVSDELAQVSMDDITFFEKSVVFYFKAYWSLQTSLI